MLKQLSSFNQLLVVRKTIFYKLPFLGFDRTSIIRWIKNFKKHGIKGLKDKNGRGRKTIFTKEIQEELKNLIEQNESITLKKIKLKIEKKFEITFSISTLHNQVKLLGYRNITSRSQHYKQDKEKLESFKKTLIEIKEKNANKPILYFDESRFGTKTKTGLGWFKKGNKTRVKVKLGFKNFYLYSSVNFAIGKHFTLLMPNVNVDCMNVYLEELSKEIKEDFS